MNKKYTVSYVLIIIVVVSAFYLYLSKESQSITIDNLKCPESYDRDIEMDAALEVFSDNFYSQNPNANISDWSKARQEFYISHNCTKTLQAIEDYKNGKADPELVKVIDETIEQYSSE